MTQDLCVRTVSRPDELLLSGSGDQAEIAAFVSELPWGGRALVVAGLPGLDESLALIHVVEAAAAAGYRVLRARAAAADANRPYAVLTDVFAPVLERAAGVPEPLREELEMALRAGTAGDGPGRPQAVARATLHVLHLLTRYTPVLVAVDDVQWADAESRAALAFALGRLHREPIGLFATVRHPVDAALSPSVAEQTAVDLLTRAPRAFATAL